MFPVSLKVRLRVWFSAKVRFWVKFKARVAVQARVEVRMVLMDKCKVRVQQRLYQGYRIGQISPPLRLVFKSCVEVFEMENLYKNQGVIKCVLQNSAFVKRLCETERSYNVAFFLSYDDYRELSLGHRYNTMCSHNSKKKKNEFYKLKGISTLIARA